MIDIEHYALTRVVAGEMFSIDFSRIVAREGELAHAIEVFQQLDRLEAFAAAKGEPAGLMLEHWYQVEDEDEWKYETVARARVAID